MSEPYEYPDQPVVMNRQTTHGNFFLSDWPLTNPDPVLRQLGKAITVYDDLSIDPRVKSALSQRLSKNKKLKWDLNKGKAKSREVIIARRMIERIGVYSKLNEVFDAIKYGMKVFEIIWTRADDGLLWPSCIGLPVEWFFFNWKGKLRWNKWGTFPKGENLPEGQYILVRHNGSYKQPYGEATLASVYWWVVFKRDLVRYWNAHTMKYGTDALYAKHDFSKNSEQAKMVEEGLRNIILQRISQFPKDVDLASLATASRDGAALYENSIGYCDKMISEAILSQALTQDSGQGGSYAKLQVGQENEYNITDADVFEIYEPFFNELIKLIWEMNFPASLERPKFQMYDENWIARARLDRDVVLAEKFGAKFTKDYLVETQNLHAEDFTLPEERDGTISNQDHGIGMEQSEARQIAGLDPNVEIPSNEKQDGVRQEEQGMIEPKTIEGFASTYAFRVERSAA